MVFYHLWRWLLRRAQSFGRSIFFCFLLYVFCLVWHTSANVAFLSRTTRLERTQLSGRLRPYGFPCRSFGDNSHAGSTNTPPLSYSRYQEFVLLWTIQLPWSSSVSKMTLYPLRKTLDTESNGFDMSITLNSTKPLEPFWNCSAGFLFPSVLTCCLEAEVYVFSGVASSGKSQAASTGKPLSAAPESTVKSNRSRHCVLWPWLSTHMSSRLLGLLVARPRAVPKLVTKLVPKRRVV